MHIVIKNIRKAIRFKEFSVFDYGLAFIFIFILAFVFLRYTNKESEIYVELIYDKPDWASEAPPPEYWEIEKLKEGDAAYNSFGSKYAEVVTIEKNFYGGGIRRFVRMVLKVKVEYNVRTKNYSLNGNDILIGKKLSFSLGETEFEGVVTNIFSNLEDRFSNYRDAKVTLKVKYYNLKPWHAEALKTFEVLGSNGVALLKTLDAEILPAEKSVETDAGNLVLARDPINKDVILTIEIPHAYCLDICFYDRRSALLVGGDFWADSGKTWLGNGSIMDVSIVFNDE